MVFARTAIVMPRTSAASPMAGPPCVRESGSSCRSTAGSLSEVASLPPAPVAARSRPDSRPTGAEPPPSQSVGPGRGRRGDVLVRGRREQPLQCVRWRPTPWRGYARATGAMSASAAASVSIASATSSTAPSLQFPGVTVSAATHAASATTAARCSTPGPALPSSMALPQRHCGRQVRPGSSWTHELPRSGPGAPSDCQRRLGPHLEVAAARARESEWRAALPPEFTQRLDPQSGA